jgi:hypothetical protein
VSLQTCDPGSLLGHDGPPLVINYSWTDDEWAQISRLETLCRSIQHWELDCRHTDVGDPWCVIYDRHEHRVILHIARIDRR